MTDANNNQGADQSIPARKSKKQQPTRYELMNKEEAKLRAQYSAGEIDKDRFDIMMGRIREQREVVVTPDTRFIRGYFQAKSNPLEVEQVIICVNGENFMFKRNTPTIVPEPVLNAAKDSKYPKYTQQPGIGRKIVAIINRFQFVPDGGDATFDEFKAMYNEGSKLTREKVAQFGLQIPIAEAVPQI